MSIHSESTDSGVPWAGIARDVEFRPADFGVMDVALQLSPELRLVAMFVKRAREAAVAYPITSPEQLEVLLGKKREYQGGGHTITVEQLQRYLTPQDFPIDHEGELAACIYAALGRCTQREQLRSALKHFDNQLKGSSASGEER